MNETFTRRETIYFHMMRTHWRGNFFRTLMMKARSGVSRVMKRSHPYITLHSIRNRQRRAKETKQQDHISKAVRANRKTEGRVAVAVAPLAEIMINYRIWVNRRAIYRSLITRVGNHIAQDYLRVKAKSQTKNVGLIVAMKILFSRHLLWIHRLLSSQWESFQTPKWVCLGYLKLWPKTLWAYKIRIY